MQVTKKEVLILNTLDKISLLLKQKGKSQKDLTDFLGLSKNAFSDWKAGRMESYLKRLPEIAQFLEVTVDSLLNNLSETEPQKKPTANNDGQDDPRWNEIRKLMEQLPPDKLEQTIQFLKFLSQNE